MSLIFLVQAAAQPQTFNLDLLTTSVGSKKLMKGVQGSLIGTATSNPTTGYSWMVASDEETACGPKGSVMLTQTYVSSRDNGEVGVGGVTHFSFTATETAIKGAKCKVGFQYAQPWNVTQGW